LPASSKTNKPRVLILNYEYPPLGGGAANATYYLLKELGLRPDDLSATLITSSVDKARHEQVAPNIDIHYLDIGKNGDIHYQSQKDLLTYSYKAYKLAKGLQRNTPFDVVHAFFGIPCGFIAMRLGLPYIVSLRGSDVPFYNERFYWQDKILFQRLSRSIWKKARHVVANSQGLKDLALDTNSQKIIEIIPNGIKLSDFEEKASINTERQLRIVSTGRLIPRKGYNLLLEALKDAQGVSATIIGDGPEKEALLSQAKELNVDLTLTGALPHEKIPMELSQHDLFVLPSYNEGMSNAALEAMAVGLPLLLTDVGGSKELIRGNGWIIPTGDVEILRRRIQEANADRTGLADLSNASVRHSKEFTWAKMAESYLNLYKA